MAKVVALRHIVILFIAVFFIACEKDRYENSSTIEVKTYSSEDKIDNSTTIGEVVDPETGKVIIVFKQQ